MCVYITEKLGGIEVLGKRLEGGGRISSLFLKKLNKMFSHFGKKYLVWIKSMI